MDNFGIKSTAIKDSATQGPNGRDGATALAGLAGSFQDLVGKAGIRLDNGFSAIIERTETSAVVERPEPAYRADDYRRDNTDHRRDRFENSPRGNDTGDDRPDAQRVEKNDDYGRDYGADNRDERGDDHARDGGADRSGDNQARDETDGNENPSTDRQASGDDHQNDDSDAPSAEAGDGNDTAQPGDASQTAAGGDASTQSTNGVLNGLLAGVEALSADGKASEQGKLSSAAGIARAISNIANAGTEKAAAQGIENMAQKAVENTSKTTPSSFAQGQSGQDNHQGQAKGAADGQSAIVAGTDGDDGAANVNAQAGGLAKAIGAGNRAQVTVTVNNESQNLTSKPGQTLTANAVLGADSGAQQTKSQNTNSHAQGNSQNPTAQAQAQLAQAAQVQNQGIQNAATQVAQAGGNATGLALASSVSSGAGTAHAGGGEGLAQAGGSSSTLQTQSQSAANQTDNTPKTFRTGHSMVEQISVKITKAIQSGSDKITIQLRPANMGRIEVKMELSQDNRLTAVITVDNRDTLEQLKNDSRSLQRALEEAGLQTDAGDLKFNLREQEGQEQDAKGSPGGFSFDDEDLAALEAEIIDPPVIAADGTIISNGRVDVRA